MFTALLFVFVGLSSAILGYFTREAREALKRIELAVKILLQRKDKEDKKGMSFGDPLTIEEFNELEDEARINALNP